MDYTRANRFHLQAKINGMTLKAGIVLRQGTLAQTLKERTYEALPDWTDVTKQPIFYAKVIDTATGDEKTVFEPSLYYNGTLVTFGAEWDYTQQSSNLSTGVYAGLFLRVYDPQTHVTTYQFRDSPFSQSNPDSDILRIEGSVLDNSGNVQMFTTPDERVLCVMVPEGSVAYRVNIQAWDIGSSHENAGQIHAYLEDISTNAKVASSNITAMKWYNMNGASEFSSDNQVAGTGMANAASGYSSTSSSDIYKLTVTDNNNVNGDELFCAEFTTAAGTFRGFANMSDLTDGFAAAFAISGGVNGELVNVGGVATVDISIIDVATGNVRTDLNYYLNVMLEKNNGSDIAKSKIYYNNSTKCVGTLKIGHKQLLDWGGACAGHISIDSTRTTGYAAITNDAPNGTSTEG